MIKTVKMRTRNVKIKPITDKCNHNIGEYTSKMRITSIKPYIHKGLHLHICYEVRCKYCNTPFECGGMPTIKDFLNTSYFTGEINF